MPSTTRGSSAKAPRPSPTVCGFASTYTVWTTWKSNSKRRGTRARRQDLLSLPPQSTEYAPLVIAALESGTSYGFMGNVVNSAQVISNLPADGCVEVPCFVDGGSIIAGSVGRLPEQCAALNRWQVNVQLLAVEGILEHRWDTIYQAAFLDPLASSQLTLDEITSLVDELVAAHGNPSGLRR